MSLAKTESSEPVASREALCQIVASHPGWWFFPTEPRTKVQGFLGTGKIFIVSDQPSMARWEHNDRNRRLFYDLLDAANAGDCHLTDLYKCRGVPSELKNGIDPLKHKDFDDHLKVFRQELNLLGPSTILAMGRIAYDLLGKYASDLDIKRVWHFGAVWHGEITPDQFKACLRGAITKARESST